MLDNIDLISVRKHGLLSEIKEKSFEVVLNSKFEKGVIFNDIKDAAKYIFRDSPVINTGDRKFRIPLGINSSKRIFIEIYRKRINKIYNRSKSKRRKGNNDICFNSLKHCKFIRVNISI